MNKNFNFVFLGTPDVASQTLDILKSNGYLPSLIITSPDKPQGRKMILTPPPVKTWAEENNVPYLQPEKINSELIEKLSIFNFELAIVVAYGKILPESFINLPKLGTINIHYSLLPKYRGASPVEAALLNGDTETGISIQQMEFKLDSGPILAEEKIEIEINDTKETLREKLIKIGGDLLCKIIPDIIEGRIEGKIQNEENATFCKKIKKEHGEIDPDGTAQENWNKYRAYHGWPGVYFFLNDRRIKITKAKYENDSFIIERVIPEGKKEVNYSDFLKNN
ncbi:MAG: methionyl-tRNA formyltransferase [Candidatus Pacebacteria bacterium]|nr:methionyl-tRNA formyltransferase [Candidatus Paceibacterota bacterium]